MRRAFGKTIVKLAEKDPAVVLLTGDVVQEMGEYIERFPGRFFNLGLTEQSIISIASGMASEGLRPVVYSITPFLLERPFEQIKIDIDEQNLPVMLVGNDDYPTHGPTHRALDARGLSKVFKNIEAYFPANMAAAEKAMLDAYLIGGPALICLKNDRLPFL